MHHREDSDSSDDDKKSKKKALASIAINNKPSLFNTPSCFMAKSTKVQKNESDSDSDEEVDLMDMLQQAHECLEMKRKECKEL